MALTPVVAALTPHVSARFARGGGIEPLEALNVPEGGLSDHVVVAGAGRVGRTIVDALAEARLAYIVIELDDRRVQDAKAEGHPVVYGDASQIVVLEAAHVSRARALLVTVPAYPEVRTIVAAARRLQPRLAIVARADSAEAVRDLYALGVTEVASPEFEAAIEMTRQALSSVGMPAENIDRLAGAIRRNRYGRNEA
jgi:CPA2 family monovalent cation:H+ antiporter-2